MKQILLTVLSTVLIIACEGSMRSSGRESSSKTSMIHSMSHFTFEVDTIERGKK